MSINHQEIEANFHELIRLLEIYFTKMELNEVIEFIEYGEYGLALDTIVDIIVEENKEIDNDIFHLLIVLSDSMLLNSEELSKKIISHIL